MATQSAAFFWALLLTVVPAAATACNHKASMRAAQDYGYELGERNLITCKTLPNLPQHNVVAFATEAEQHKYTLTVLVVTKSTGKVLQKFVDTDTSFGPAGDPTKIDIDTANYLLAPNERAFAVRVTYSLNSWDRTEDLNLFLAKGDQLVRLLKDLTTSFSSMRDCMDSKEIKRTITLSDKESYGYRDLIVSTTEIEHEPIASQQGECSSRKIHRTRTALFKFSGGAYVHPENFY